VFLKQSFVEPVGSFLACQRDLQDVLNRIVHGVYPFLRPNTV
jgi:hypothetical protein